MIIGRSIVGAVAAFSVTVPSPLPVARICAAVAAAYCSSVAVSLSPISSFESAITPVTDSVIVLLLHADAEAVTTVSVAGAA